MLKAQTYVAILCALLFAVGAPAALGNTVAWVTEEVATGTPNYEGMALVVDSLNDPHLVFASGDGSSLVELTRNAGGTWATSTSAMPTNPDGSSQVAKYMSAAIGPNNTIQMAFRWQGQTGVPDSLGYATVTSSGVWSKQLVQGTTAFQSSGKEPSIAVDSSNQPHIASWDSSGGATLMWYSYLSGSTWTNIQLTPTTEPEDYLNPKIALGSNGNAYVTYTNTNPNPGTNEWLQMATIAPDGTVTTQTIDSNGRAGKQGNALVVDKNNNVDVAYFQYSEDVGEYPIFATNASGSWVYKSDFEPQEVYWPGGWGQTANGAWPMALDANGNPVFVYANQYGTGLMYATYDGTDVSAQTVIPGTGAGYSIMDPNLVFDASGNPGIAYDDGHGDIYFTYAEGSFQPIASPVPEPISMIFFGTGLVAVGGFVARRRMAHKA